MPAQVGVDLVIFTQPVYLLNSLREETQRLGPTPNNNNRGEGQWTLIRDDVEYLLTETLAAIPKKAGWHTGSNAPSFWKVEKILNHERQQSAISSILWHPLSSCVILRCSMALAQLSLFTEWACAALPLKAAVGVQRVNTVVQSFTVVPGHRKSV